MSPQERFALTQILGWASDAHAELLMLPMAPHAVSDSRQALARIALKSQELLNLDNKKVPAATGTQKP